MFNENSPFDFFVVYLTATASILFWHDWPCPALLFFRPRCIRRNGLYRKKESPAEGKSLDRANGWCVFLCVRVLQQVLPLLPPGLRAFALYVQAHYLYLKEDYSHSAGMVAATLMRFIQFGQ